jgi:hypothetical protein
MPAEMGAHTTSDQRRVLRQLGAMVLAALAVRLLVVAFVYQDLLDPRQEHWPFGYEMGRIARSIATGHGFGNPLFVETGPTAWIAPAFPNLLAGIFKIFGIYTKASALAILTSDSLFSALTCLPVYFIARRAFNARVAVWSGWVWVFSPYAIYLSATWIWETCLLTLLMSLLVLMALRLERTGGLCAWIGFGLLWGVAALTNPVALSAAPFLGGWLCWRLHLQGRRWLLPSAAAALALVVMITPWLARNEHVFHRPVFLKDNFWLAFRVGNSGSFLHWWNDLAHPSHNPAELAELRRVGEAAYMVEKREQSLAWVRAHPGLLAWVSLRRFVYLWTGYWSLRLEYLEIEPYDPANIVLCTGLTVLALLGLRRAFRARSPAAMPFALLLLSFPLAYYLASVEFTYRHPIDPELVILAVAAISRRLPGKSTTATESI